MTNFQSALIVKRKDEAKFNGDYRTKRIILEIYGTLADAMKSGKPIKTRLDPTPADQTCCRPPKEQSTPNNPNRGWILS